VKNNKKNIVKNKFNLDGKKMNLTLKNLKKVDNKINT